MESDSVVELPSSVVVVAVVLSVDDAVVDSSDEVELVVVLSSVEDEEEDEVVFELVLEDLLEVDVEVAFDDVVLVDVVLEEVEVVEVEVGLADDEDFEEVVLVVLELEVTTLQRPDPVHSVPSLQYDLPLQHSASSGMQPVPQGDWPSSQLDWRRCKSESNRPSRTFLGYSRISWLSKRALAFV